MRSAKLNVTELSRTKTFDTLFTDRGWLTARGIALRSNQVLNTVQKALARLERIGVVEKRLHPTDQYDIVYEYRVNPLALEDEDE